MDTGNVDILTLHQFMGDVITLIQGDHNRSDFINAPVEITDGSVKIRSFLSTILLSSLLSDIEHLKSSRDLDAISPKRAEVFSKWGKKAQSIKSKFEYSLMAEHVDLEDRKLFLINAESGFRHRQKDLWVKAEKYLTGKVVDAGGKNKPNIHLVLPSGVTVMIGATEQQLKGQPYIYENMTFNVSAKEHLKTGEIKDAVLLDAVEASKEIDEDELKLLWSKGEEAWKDVESANQWVESLRSA